MSSQLLWLYSSSVLTMVFAALYFSPEPNFSTVPIMNPQGVTACLAQRSSHR